MIESTVEPESKSIFNPFAGPEIERIMHTTQSQTEIWLACKLGDIDASRAYNESISLILKGHLNKSAILKAIQSIVNRHECLRSVFSSDGRYMTVFKHVAVLLDIQDTSASSKIEKDEILKNCLSTDANYVFDLLRGPLFKVGLIKVSEEEHHLIITAHHIVFDGWSAGILLEELGSLYSANVNNTHHNLPQAESFCAYAEEQHAFMASEVYDITENYWLNEFKDNVPQLTLPTDFPRPEVRTFKSERLDVSMGTELVSALKKTGIKAGCSLVTTLLSAFEIFIYTQTGQDDIVLGLPSADQAASGKLQMIGHCVNLLPLRSKIDVNISFDDYLKQRKPQLFDAYDQQQISFGQLLQKLSIARDPSRVPLVPVVFNIDMGMTNAVSFTDLSYELKSNPRAYDAFEIFLNASGSEENLILEWAYNTALFKPETIKQMMVSFQSLIQKLIESHDLKLKEILKVDDSAYINVNETDATYPKLPLHQLIAKQAKQSPDTKALKFEQSEITYKDLELQINRLAHSLAEKGVKPNTIVAVAAPRSIELVVSLLAIMQCGAAYLPLDPSYPQHRLDFMLSDSDAEVVIASNKTSIKSEASKKQLVLEDLFLNLTEYSSNPLSLSVDIEEKAYLLYTSGSTGNPKGVEVTHKNLVNFLFSMLAEPGIKETDKLLSITTISFDIAGLELFLPLLKGATLVIANDDVAKDGRLLLEYIVDESITMLQATPTTWQMLLDSGWVDKLPIKALCGGEKLPMPLAKKIIPKVNELWNMYGPTETTIWSTTKQILIDDEVLTIGKPIANTQVYILNDQGLLMKPGAIGEIVIGGDGVANGYWKREDLTAEKFISSPFDSEPNVKLYRTGDLGRLLSNDEFECLGRMDDQVKIRGHRIELGEIEEVMITIEDIESCVVMIDEDRLKAFVKAKESFSFSQDILQKWRTHLKELLPLYMVPHDINLVNEFPTTLNGKIDRKTLLNNSKLTSQSITGKTAPRSAMEKLVASVWESSLKIKDIDVFSNFFEIGGHSLIAVRVMASLEKETGTRLPLSALMTHSTIEKLAQLMEMDDEENSWSSLVPIKPDGNKTPLYVVHGEFYNVLFLNSLVKNVDSEQPLYGLQAKGLNEEDTPHDKIEDMAAHYISEILESNPEGPYAIAGYSFGGIIAFEMARQLKAQGKTVEKFISFDSYVFPDYYYPDAFRKQFMTGFYTSGKVVFALSKMFSSADKFKERIRIFRNMLNQIFSRVKHNNKEHKLERKELQDLLELNVGKETLKNLSSHHSLAVDSYHIVPEDLKVDLMVADDDVFFKHDKKYYGWKSLAKQGVQRHSVSGNHANMFVAPNDKQFGLVLQKILDS
ncbi:non-ribosomal peptide synthetase [Winogradskyella helgolandensis]|uniref:non-ribosomal peptide synthetase n=1 Tax=Winogradskyella helgolandensis TaxID=2697010 RepID=UPI0015BDE7E0|nr:non-ribosomal peptide synthetase [Winogradskyella helgolandensis]